MPVIFHQPDPNATLPGFDILSTESACKRMFNIQVLGFPLHGVVNAAVAARMVEEKPLLNGAGSHFSILGKVNGSLGEAVWLAARVDPIHVRLMFLISDVGVQDGCQNKEEDGRQQSDKGKHSRIANAADLPYLAPPAQRPVESPPQEAKRCKGEDQESGEQLRDVPQDVVAHFVTHHRLYFPWRTAFDQIVIQRDAHRLSEAADVRAHSCGLF